MISSIYDPLGVLAPVLLEEKCLLQLLCKDKVDLGHNLWPIFVQFRCPHSPTTFSPHDSIDFYVLNSNFHVVTSKNLQFFCNLRSKIDLFH